MPIDYGNVVSGSAALPSGINATFGYCRITGFLIPTETGAYALGVNCQDGCSLFIGAQETCLVDNMDSTDVALGTLGFTSAAKLSLTAGQFYPFIIEWQWGASGAYELQLAWVRPGSATIELIPDANLSDVSGSISQRINAAFWNGDSTWWYPKGDLGPSAGGVNPPTFGSGAPSGSPATAADLFYFDNSTTPFTGYVWDGSAWQQFGGGGGGASGGFSSGSNSNGIWVQDPTGYVRQWGRVTTDINSGTVAVTFPTPFASGSAAAGNVAVVAATRSGTDRITFVVDGSVSDTGFTVGNNGSGGYADWEASGPGTGTGTAAVTFGSGAPSGSAFEGALYFDTSASPYAEYVYHSSAWQAAGSSGGGGSSGAFAFSEIQEALFQSGGGNVSSFTATFPQPLQASAATAFLLIACDGSSAVTIPTGWTLDFDQQENTYSRLILCHKTSAGDADATMSVGAASSFAVWFFELSGTRALDQLSDGGMANTSPVQTPGITPTAGALVVSAACLVGNNQPGTGFVGEYLLAQWNALAIQGSAPGARALAGLVYRFASDGSALTPPLIAFPGLTLFSGGGIAYATFSIV
jgi:hypothetical protein